MNPLLRMRAELAARIAGLSIKAQEPAIESGNWHLDIKRDGKHLMLVEWRPKGGFGFSTPKLDAVRSGHDEIATDYDQALARIVHLLETGGGTIPPLPIRLAELRQARGLTQTELAERAGLAQADLSRVESQGDMELGTLKKIVTAMGASLSIVAKFPDGSNWELRV